MKRDFISITDLTSSEMLEVIVRAREMKTAGGSSSLSGMNVALIFEKPSLRTKVSFQVGVQELGGFSLYLSPDEVGLGEREPVSDVARVLSGYVDCIVARVFSHETLQELACYSDVPVINALSDMEHPCQIMSDLLTISEQKEDLKKLKLAYIGDGNNVARTLCKSISSLGMDFAIASPFGYGLDQESIDIGRRNSADGAIISISNNPHEAVASADIVYTDVWTSMGDESEAEMRRSIFSGYTVDSELLSEAKPDAIFMHDMPAHYGEEVVEGMLEHPQSVAYVQAHNRLHCQKAILEFILQGY
jgi:ornithine carbamoyltransferase